jgi:hypothetical protein
MHTPESAAPPDVMDIFDELEPGLACRICGALVADTEPYRRAHWDWHEATNGA